MNVESRETTVQRDHSVPAEFDFLEHSTDECADTISWCNRKLPGGQHRMLCVIGVLLLWLSAVLIVTDWAIVDRAPGIWVDILVIAVWESILFPLHFLCKAAGCESIRITDKTITFSFAGLRLREILVLRDELKSIGLDDCSEINQDLQYKRFFGIALPWSKQIVTIVLAEGMEHSQKMELHKLLCSILTKREWVFIPQIRQATGNVETATLTIVDSR